jgi:hypothetical protein
MTMPDLQTAMQKILQSWEQPETTETTTTETTKETTVFKPTTNTSRECFEIVRDNPGNSKKECIRLLGLKGFKPSSTSSLLSQMTRQGLIWRDSSGGLHPNAKEYSPLKAVKVFKAKKASPAKTSKLRTSEPVVEPKREVINVPVRTNIEVILDTITLSEAHELYSKLHKYFGGLSK